MSSGSYRRGLRVSGRSEAARSCDSGRKRKLAVAAGSMVTVVWAIPREKRVCALGKEWRTWLP